VWFGAIQGIAKSDPIVKRNGLHSVDFFGIYIHDSLC
jgi:hypothetical protein